ncbi:MAG TPA: hypothetical protein VMI92_03060, partial [Steroidobacteraceae bacterium]|nr:hypothetical protein [Steroidobacteraceae bacterium]
MAEVESPRRIRFSFLIPLRSKRDRRTDPRRRALPASVIAAVPGTVKAASAPYAAAQLLGDMKELG